MEGNLLRATPSAGFPPSATKRTIHLLRNRTFLFTPDTKANGIGTRTCTGDRHHRRRHAVIARCSALQCRAWPRSHPGSGSRRRRVGALLLRAAPASTGREERSMAKGRCLCGALSYELDGPFSAMIHCHCSMCRKHHGTGFATFVVAPIAGLRWTSGEDRLARYRSSPNGVRTFCSVCGSAGGPPEAGGGGPRRPARRPGGG